MSSLITEQLVSLDRDLGINNREVITSLVDIVFQAGRTNNPSQLLADAYAREEKSSTGVPGGIAIPHCKTTAVSEPTLAFARLEPPADFGATEPADLVFFIMAPEGSNEDHLKILSQLARSLMNKKFTEALREAKNKQEVVWLISEVLRSSSTAAEPPNNPPNHSPSQHGDDSTETVPLTTADLPSDQSAHTKNTDEKPEADTDPINVIEPAETSGGGTGAKKIVAVTACPTGIAHTYMAADSLKNSADAAGVELAVETQGSSGAEKLAAETTAAADAVIFAADVDVRDRDRFAGLPVISSGVKRGIDEPDQMIAEAVAASNNPQAPRVSNSSESKSDNSNSQSTSNNNNQTKESTSTGSGIKKFGNNLRTWLLTGVSYMIPFVAAGGLLIALAFLLGDIYIAADDNATKIITDYSLFNLPDDFSVVGEGFSGRPPVLVYLAALCQLLGQTAMGFMLPALAGYIAYGMADRPGIAPGFVAGAIAGLLNAGFLGAIVGGLLAGAVAMGLGRLKVPRWLAGLMPVVIIPLIATLVAGGLMVLVLAEPIAWVMERLTEFLTSLNGETAAILGLILGLMMCFDLGGPVNKVAYAFAVTGLASGSVEGNPQPLMIMAAVMGSGMVPPLAMALASTVRKKLFPPAEQEQGKAAWLLGAAFISEGAIPFAATDPIRVIGASMVGGGATGALMMWTGVTQMAPHGGFFVLFTMNNPIVFVVNVAIGTLISAALVIVFKEFFHSKPKAGEDNSGTENSSYASTPSLNDNDKERVKATSLSSQENPKNDTQQFQETTQNSGKRK